MAKVYGNAPIQEALCDFRFVPDGTWDATSVGFIYDRLQEPPAFSQKQQVTNFNITLTTEANHIGQAFGVTPQMRFMPADDDKTLVQVAPYMLAVNRLRPYKGWEAFRPSILRGYNAYRAVSPGATLQSVTLRYINRITFSMTTLNLEHYFRFYPRLDIGDMQDYSNFFSAVQVPFKGNRDVLTLMLATPLESQPEHTIAVDLDLGYQLRQPESIPLDGIPDWIDQAHAHIEHIFEECITDELRIQFKEVHD